MAGMQLSPTLYPPLALFWESKSRFALVLCNNEWAKWVRDGDKNQKEMQDEKSESIVVFSIMFFILRYYIL